MYYVFMFNRQLFSECHHKRSNAEPVFSMVKERFGDAVRSKSEEGQVNEVLAKVLCHNICVRVRAVHEQGIEPTSGAGSPSGLDDYIYICKMHIDYGREKYEQRGQGAGYRFAGAWLSRG